MEPVLLSGPLRGFESQTGFSLVEVLTCVAILPVAFCGLLALLGIGLSQCRESAEATEAQQLAQMVLASLSADSFQASPLFQTPDHAPLCLGTRTPSDPPVELSAWTQNPPPRFHADPPGSSSPCPVIWRTRDNQPEANFKILLRFEPVGRGGPAAEKSCRGTMAGIQILHLPSKRTVFQSNQFIARNPPPAPFP